MDLNFGCIEWHYLSELIPIKKVLFRHYFFIKDKEKFGRNSENELKENPTYTLLTKIKGIHICLQIVVFNSQLKMNSKPEK